MPTARCRQGMYATNVIRFYKKIFQFVKYFLFLTTDAKFRRCGAELPPLSLWPWA